MAGRGGEVPPWGGAEAAGAMGTGEGSCGVSLEKDGPHGADKLGIVYGDV